MTRVESARPDSLSVPEMLRIMDVATAIRQDRELVEEQLNVEELKARLKERMLAASQVTGESVTPEEVDAAIRHYYANLYTFREPKLSFPVALAHVWVRRQQILGLGIVALATVVLAWWLFDSPNAPLTARGRAHRQLERLSAEIHRRAEVVRSLSHDPKVESEVASLLQQDVAYRRKEDPKGLATVRDSLALMESKLGEEYAITVVPGAKAESGFARTYSDKDGKRQPSYYLVVEARSADGNVLTRHIRNAEDGSYQDVTRWAERVPEAVFRRIAKDKREDGVLNETAFAVKRKGSLDEEITMPGLDGKPFTRMGQLAKW